MKKLTGILLIAAFLFTNIIIPSGASAQGITVLGEIRNSGEVFIESSAGQFISAGKTYPILQNTSIRTDEGSASLLFREGSRVDLSKNSAAVIDGAPADYSIFLSKGVAAFNISASASLYVSTPTGSISVNGKNGVIQKVNFEKGVRTLGVISVTDKGTEVRSVSGRILVNVSATETKVIANGESLMLGPDSAHRVYKTQGVIEGSILGFNTVGAINAGFMTLTAIGGGAAATQGNNPPRPGTTASPSGFLVR